MYGLSVLPVGLIALLLSSPALCAEPTTPADPFYHIAKHAHRPPEPPVCCLKPLESNELYEPAEEVLSFEEWKSKQEQALRLEQAEGLKSRGSAAKTNTPSTASDATQESRHEAGEAEGPPPLEPPAPPPPHFRVPLTDRFNYASLDCSARVHYAHKSARSASSLLSSKKDRYMLSPCNTPGEDKFVVVELCEDIRIDTVQLANFEFFSGVFKDFSVSVARTYTTDPEGWTSAGTYRAKNIRGIQSFHPPTSLRDFYRFIRIDFHSYYGNEYYCPISLLRVYGLTHLEQWKWEVWEAEYKAKGEAQASLRAIASAPAPPPAAGAGVEEDVRVVSGTMDKAETTPGDQPSTTSRSEPDTTLGSIQKEVTATSVQSESLTITSIMDEPFKAMKELDQSQSSESLYRDSSLASSSSGNTPISSESTSTIPSSSTSSTPARSIPEPSPSEFHVRNASTAVTQSFNTSSSHSAQKLNTTSTSQVSATQMPTIVAHESRGVPAITATGESIYRTIMTRLSILEANSSLYLRYVEEQTRSLRDALTRLEEDVGRLDGLSKATTQSFQKIINEMDRQRRRLEREHGELQTRVDFLTDEVILEKRLGIAQLCLLLVVLVFMALTRGSRGEPFIPQVTIRRRDALREWGRRQLSSFSSGEWASKLRSGSPSHMPGDFVESPIPVKPEKVRFPAQQPREAGDETPRGSTSSLRTPSKSGRTLAEIRALLPRQFLLHSHSHRPRTPTTAGFNLYAQATRSAGLLGASSAPSQGMARPRLRRANSHSTPAPAVGNSKSMVEGTTSVSGSGVLASARKWAKSAHWHEIRRRSPRRAGETSIPAGSTSTLATAQVKSDQENAKDTEGTSEDFKEYLSEMPPNSHSHPRVPLSTSPLQNRSRRQYKADLETIRLEQLQSSQSSKSSSKIVDLDTESESWEDTDADPFEVD